MRLSRLQRAWYFIQQQTRNIKLRQSTIDTSIRTLGVFGDSIAAASSTNSSDTDSIITAITNANPGKVTKTAHGFTTGDSIFHWGVKGMTQLNENEYTISVIDANNYTLGVDTTSYGTWASGTGIGNNGGKSYRKKNAVYSKLAQGLVSGVNMLSGQRFQYVHLNNRAIGGNSWAELDARKGFSIPSYLGITDIILNCGTNDTHAAISLATATPYITSVLNYLTVTLGIRVWLMAVPPRNDSTTAARLQYNAYYASLESNMVRFVDDWSLLYDNGTDSWKAGYSYDETHPNPTGGFVRSKAIKDKIVQYYGEGSGFVLNANNKLLNPTMLGATGTVSGNVTNNGVATSWVAEAAGTGAIGTRTASKNVNDKQVLTVNAGSGLSTSEGIRIRQDVLGANLTVGTKYIAEFEIKLDNWSGTGVFYELALELRNNATGFAFDNARRNNDPINATGLIAHCTTKTLLLTSPPTEFLTGWTLLRPRLNAHAKCDTGTAQIQVTVLNAQLYPA